MSVGKDSDQVANFLSHFSKLRKWVYDEPGQLAELSSDDPDLAELCRKIYSLACELKAAERMRRELFAERSNPGFIEKWRVFESRYAASVENIAVSPFFGVGIFKDIESHVKLNTAIEADLFQKALEFAERECQNGSYAEASSEYFFDPDEPGSYSMTVEECVQSGISSWRDFTGATGFDFENVLVRRAMVPFVLVPRHVSDGIGNDEKFSLYTQLKEAHDAFIFGLPHACMAMMRSTLEVVLKKHYRVKGNHLNELLKNVMHRPEIANWARLDQLRLTGNKALHGKEVSEGKVSKLSAEITNDTILDFLHTLRVLIEAAPAIPPGG
ncbi:MAG: DUF4145 domain-containing protein [Aestuariivirga sp.]|nr:DUF4145 domain-containing protein [Aestuariivirga sp.]